MLSRLDAIQSPGSATGRKLLKAAAYLSALMRMYGGSPSIRVLTRRGGLKPEAERRHIEVRRALSPSYPYSTTSAAGCLSCLFAIGQ